MEYVANDFNLNPIFMKCLLVLFGYAYLMSNGKFDYDYLTESEKALVTREEFNGAVFKYNEAKELKII